MSNVKVLFFAADPLSIPPHGGKRRLLLDEDVRLIREKVHTAEHRYALDFDWHPAARTEDLMLALHQTKPQVVHFSGHGGAEGLVLVGRDGRSAHRVGEDALRELFEAFRGDICLVVLSACSSLPQAEAIAEVVGCAIGTASDISDEAAILFNAEFYRALAFGDSVDAAVRKARAALALNHLDQVRPDLVVRTDVDPAQLFLVPTRSDVPNDPETAEPRRTQEAAPPPHFTASAEPPPSTAAPAPPVAPPQDEDAPARSIRRVVLVAAGLALSGAVAAAIANIGDRTPGEQTAVSKSAGALCARSSGLPATAAASRTAGDPSGARSDIAAAKDLYAAGDQAAAFPLFKRAAEAGNPEAMGFLGIAYLCGAGTESRTDLGVQWLVQGAYKRDPHAMNALGVAYQNGEGVDRSLRWARHWLRAAAEEKGYAEAMRNLGSLFRDTEDRNYDSARIWYEKAARAGSLDAMVDLGRMHEEGLGVPRNPEEARGRYQAAADAGSPRGMLAMGRIYQDAVGVPRDYGKAREWYLRAVDAGSADAMSNLGLLYQKGWGVPADQAEAIRWYRRARDAGSTVAAGNLAALGAS